MHPSHRLVTANSSRQELASAKKKCLPKLTFSGDKISSFAALGLRNFPLQLSSTRLEAAINLRYDNTS